MKILPSARGITLVETMASIFLFSLVLGAILEMAIQNTTMGVRSENAYRAYNLAKNHIETLKSLPFGSLASAAESNTLLDSSGVSDPDGAFKRTTTVTTNYTSDANLVQITTSVDYKVKNQFVGHPMTITTVVFQYA